MKKIINNFVGGLLALSALLPSVGQSEIYKWVDDNGVTHYSDRMGGAKNAQEIDVRIAPPPEDSETAAERAERFKQLNEAHREKKAEQRELAKERQAERSKKQQACNDAKKRLAKYQNHTRIYKVNPETGQKEYFTDDQYKSALNKAKSDVAKNCR